MRKTRSMRLLRSMLAGALLAGGGVAATVVTAPAASALCAADNLHGAWHALDAGTRALTRVTVETCAPVVTCDGDICTVRHDAGTFTSVWGKCSPTDCPWGRKQAQPMGNGWYRSVYPFGFKTSSVWVKTYSFSGRTYLRVYSYNDFTAADGRADYTTDEWFVK